jgi:hypothetical protein
LASRPYSLLTRAADFFKIPIAVMTGCWKNDKSQF